MTPIVIVFLASGLGGVSRYLLAGAITAWLGRGFPSGTLVVNVLGCLIAGAVSAALARAAGPEHLRLALLTGFLGGFTTFSAFGVETISMIQERHWGLAAAYVATSVGFGLAGVWLGFAAAGALTARS